MAVHEPRTFWLHFCANLGSGGDSSLFVNGLILALKLFAGVTKRN